MNKCIFVGRLTRDPDVRYSQGAESTCVARFSLAVDRRIAKKNENQQTADFINCVAFGKTGEFVEKYARKGMRFAIESHVQTGSYVKEGTKVYTTDFIIDSMEFAESKSANEQAAGAVPVPTPRDDEGFMNVPDGIDSELPFE